MMPLVGLHQAFLMIVAPTWGVGGRENGEREKGEQENGLQRMPQSHDPWKFSRADDIFQSRPALLFCMNQRPQD